MGGISSAALLVMPLWQFVPARIIPAIAVYGINTRFGFLLEQVFQPCAILKRIVQIVNNGIWCIRVRKILLCDNTSIVVLDENSCYPLFLPVLPLVQLLFTC